MTAHATMSHDDPNAEQIAYWNGPAGQRWLERQESQDALLAPVTDALLVRAAPQAGEHAIDVGCGCGSTSIVLAGRVAPGGSVLGIDISEPMLRRARELGRHTPALRFERADATTYPFEAGTADLLVSRFGVMFFAEPARSFANLRRALHPHGRLTFACWREPRANPWLLLPLQEVTKHVPRLPEADPDDPGPFAFADPGRVRRILEEAGFAAIEFEPRELSFDLAQGRGLDAAVEAAIALGPASRALEGQDDAARAAATAALRIALARHAAGGRVPLPGAIWLVSAAAR